ncbi:glycerol-3-phosphate dehydrogenase [Cyanidiococcus yangmingshanensis]|uniref:Glycerol-3-phosphate dehydrogenase [NAD(+)] n=1 Tax=Cyanidiococcus yangmingshanensis TaxID=2690220 RepID=A0A7J7IFA7_9RHOD|nr:glycerol-3-phosphate dehydrogenase [Cyanidiococcus yangmingshanensis]
MSEKHKVAILGSGNWGSTVARIVGSNVRDRTEVFDPEVRIWVYEELIGGRKLTEIINSEHENVKYLPGKELPENVIAIPDPETAIEGANILVFVLPHQFVRSLCGKLAGKIRENAFAVSLIKGVDFDEKGVILISDVISRELGVECSVLMGANIANEIADEQFSEATIGYRNREHARLLKHIFQTPYFRIAGAPDVPGVEICGALKNIVALGAGFCDGLGYGNNTKAAVIRLGLIEMIRFAKKFFKDVQSMTFLQSSGVADLITTCYGGRNRRCAEAFARSGGKKSFEELENELLNGQKLQGTLTAKEIYEILQRQNLLQEFPFFEVIYAIAYQGRSVEGFLQQLSEKELSLEGDID